MHFTPAKAQSNDVKLISAINVEKNDTEIDVRGLKVTYTCNVSNLGNAAFIDSVLKITTFKIKTRIFLKDEAVNPGYGYSKLSNKKNDLEFTSYISNIVLKDKKTGTAITVFIPYAALKLPDLTSYTVTVKASLFSTVVISSTAVITEKQVQSIEQANISFYKPETAVASIYVDSIEVTTLDNKGSAWDYSFFGKDYPDIGVAIKMAGNTLWDKHTNNNFLFVLKPNDKNCSFTISKNDKFTILVEDRDLLMHDFIDQFECVTADIAKGQFYPLIPNNNTIKKCTFRYRVN